jgi:hypothetical protein
LLNRTLITGGRYSSTDPESGETVFNGLEAGKTYVVEARTYKIMSDESILYSTALVSDEITMVEPTVTEPKFSIEGSTSLAVGLTTVKVDTVNKSSFTVKIDGVDKVLSGSYTLNKGEEISWNGGDISLNDLEDGTYTLSLKGVNGTKDSFAGLYQFTVDTSAPEIMISSPQGGGFFEGDSIVVTGISEPGATVIAGIDGGESVTVTVDDSGAFSVIVPLDDSLAYQDLRVYAEDAVQNRSMPFGCTLTNALMGENDLQAVILINGEVVTEIASSDQAKQLTMGFKSGDKIVTLNSNSLAAARVYWKTSMIEKSAKVSDSGVLIGDEGAVGLVTATLDNFTAVAKINAMNVAESEIEIVIPEGGIVYDGEEKTPEIRFGGYEELEEGVDYSVTYFNNVNAGTASVVIEGIGEGKISGIRVLNFEIEKRAIGDTEISVEDEGFTKPGVKVTFKGAELKKGTDYKVEYVINAKENKVIVNVEGIGNFENVASFSREIDTSFFGGIRNWFNDVKLALSGDGNGCNGCNGGCGSSIGVGAIIITTLLSAMFVMTDKKKKKQ